MNCPYCGTENYYVGLNLRESEGKCTNLSCHKYVAPKPVLDPGIVHKINEAQSKHQHAYPIGPVSPPDRPVFCLSTQDLGIQNRPENEVPDYLLRVPQAEFADPASGSVRIQNNTNKPIHFLDTRIPTAEYVDHSEVVARVEEALKTLEKYSAYVKSYTADQQRGWDGHAGVFYYCEVDLKIQIAYKKPDVE